MAPRRGVIRGLLDGDQGARPQAWRTLSTTPRQHLYLAVNDERLIAVIDRPGYGSRRRDGTDPGRRPACSFFVPFLLQLMLIFSKSKKPRLLHYYGSLLLRSNVYYYV
jgi:hypothetical protein